MTATACRYCNATFIEMPPKTSAAASMSYHCKCGVHYEPNDGDWEPVAFGTSTYRARSDLSWVDFGADLLLNHALVHFPTLPKQIVDAIRSKTPVSAHVLTGTAWFDAGILLYELMQLHYDLRFKCSFCSHRRITSQGSKIMTCICSRVFEGGIGRWLSVYPLIIDKAVSIEENLPIPCTGCRQASHHARNDARGRCYDCNEARR